MKHRRDLHCDSSVRVVDEKPNKEAVACIPPTLLKMPSGREPGQQLAHFISPISSLIVRPKRVYPSSRSSDLFRFAVVGRQGKLRGYSAQSFVDLALVQVRRRHSLA